ncbi:hypothetical protein ELH77_19070 [Rhizobium ruizarguesonis]|uniref:hypothetical protein n=1 Tax=Rhizobium ruizarguesonis TaxID=2081791 RepID=UPI001030CCA5|nr:hypothetical protein [Rhizobium ruizarguesonis]TAZ20708.1 hypothetical protein ELH77_19070 [Rhizobium ruizarguesonis]
MNEVGFPQALKLISERGPAHSRLTQTLRDVRTVERQLGELALALTGSRPEGVAAMTVEPPQGLFARLDGTIREIESEVAAMRAVIDHIKRQM